MNTFTTDTGRSDQSANVIPLGGRSFSGWALEPHTIACRTVSGASTTMRGDLAEKMYRFRYQGESHLLAPIIERFLHGIQSLFPGAGRFDLMVMVPPPIGRADYAPVAALSAELSRRTRIPSAQYAVKSAVIDAPDDRPGPRRSDRMFSFSSAPTAAIFSGKRVLVVDDIVRSGRSLERFCNLLKNEGGAAHVAVVAGSVTVEKPSRHAVSGSRARRPPR